MNKKLLASCLALTICLTAVGPIYSLISPERENLDTKTSEALHQQSLYEDRTELLQANTEETFISEPVETKQALDTTKAEESTSIVKAAPKTASKTAPKPSISSRGTTTKKTTVAKPATKSTTTTSKSTTTTTTAKTAPAVNTAVAKTAPATNATVASATTSKASAIISTAKSFMGVPYVWGGTTPSGFDCSGYIQYVLNKHDITVPRTSAEQYTAGLSVAKSNLISGDLVFFTTYKPGPSHLGIYLGSGQFIHASSSKGVTISSIDSSYYSSRYIGARRVIK